MEIETLRVPSKGSELACSVWGAGPPLLLAHPILFSKAYFSAAAETWGARFRCVAFDQRGHGDTTASTIAAASMSHDIGAILDAMNWEKAAIGGTSLGAATTLMFALRNPARVSFLVQDLPAFGPGTSRDPVKSGRIANALEDADLEEAARRICEGMSPPRAKAWTEAIFADWRLYDPATLGPKLGWALRNTGSFRVVDHWPRDLAALKLPVRILAVQGDPAHPWEIAQTMAKSISGARLIPRVQSLSPEAIANQWIEVLSS